MPLLFPPWKELPPFRLAGGIPRSWHQEMVELNHRYGGGGNKDPAPENGWKGFFVPECDRTVESRDADLQDGWSFGMINGSYFG